MTVMLHNRPQPVEAGYRVVCAWCKAVIQDGLRKAIGCRILHAKYKVGVKDGKIGVWFHL